jgi:uncharacterized protein YceK
VIGIALTLGGCSTALTNAMNSGDPCPPPINPIYSGTTFDAFTLWWAASGENRRPICTIDSTTLKLCEDKSREVDITESIGIGTASLIDMPISFVADTVLLPHSIRHKLKCKNASLK